jgi:hypothetical protein
MSGLIDLYPETIKTRRGTLRLVSARPGGADKDSQFNVLEVVHGRPCDGLVYEADDETRRRVLLAVFYGEHDDDTRIAIVRDWQWEWWAADGAQMPYFIRTAILFSYERNTAGHPTPDFAPIHAKEAA